MIGPRSRLGGALAVAAMAAVLAGAFGVLSGLGPVHVPLAPSEKAPASSAGPAVHPAGLPPTVAFLNGSGVLVGANGANFPLNFTVPAGATEEFYLWSIGGGLATFQLPTLPLGMSVMANTSTAGVAAGNLTPGSYSSDLYYAGWTNDVSLAVYALVGSTGATFQFGATNVSNPAPGTEVVPVNVTLPSGAIAYLGVAGTGGYALSSWSMTDLQEEAPAWLMAGVTQVIGNQSTSVIGASSAAEGLAVAGVGIYQTAVPSGPTPELLASLEGLVGATDASFPLDFTVPVGMTHVLYAWAIGGGLASYEPPTLPTGMTVAASLSTAGLAIGSLAPGTYATNLTYPGWTNEVSIAVYGVLNGGNTSYRFGVASVQNPFGGPNNTSEQATLDLPSGGAAYVGVATTGGFPLSAVSMPIVDVEAPAWMTGGVTEVIGLQANATLWAQSSAFGEGIVGVGIYSNLTNVTFQESGLPTGAPWQLVLNGVPTTVTTSSVTVPEPPGSVTYLVSGPSGYHVQGLAPGGTIAATGANVVESISFVKGKTVSLTVQESGLPSFAPWCFSFSGEQVCSTTASVSFGNLTPASYAYAVELWPGIPVTTSYAHKALASSGELTVTATRALDVKFAYPYAVTFDETGLSIGTWSVKVDGATKSATAGEPIVFWLPDGTYGYHVTKVRGYGVVGLPAKAKVDNGRTTVDVFFVANG